jgi:3'(2'),5'-bisphosphate nucleotidase
LRVGAHPLWLRLVDIALAAGRLQRSHFRQRPAVQTKADLSPVTIADTETEALIHAALGDAAGDIPVVAEEAVAAGQVPKVGTRFFLVDPLDGTREFVAGRDEFTVNIALIEAGRPVLGVVLRPIAGTLFCVGGGGEALAADAGDLVGPAEHLAFRRISTRVANPSALVAMVSRSHLTPQTEAYLAGLSIAERRAVGSSIKFCAIAEGAADIYPRFGPTNEWDTAAGHAVLSAAGGSVCEPDGQPLTYGHARRRFRNPDYIAWGGPASTLPDAN